MIAKVIVDINNKQLDKAFDYIIPNKFSVIIERGSRVVVPFGARKLLGFVISIEPTSDLLELKEIIDVIDFEPSLSEELLQLGFEISQETGCNKIQAFQSMLPAAMKLKYTKAFKLLNRDMLASELQDLFKESDLVYYSSNLDDRLSIIKKQIQEGIIEVSYGTMKKASILKEKYLEINLKLNFEECYHQLKAAKKQRQIFEYLYNNSGKQKEKDVLRLFNTTRSVINGLLDKNYIIESTEDIYRIITDKTFRDKVVSLNKEQQIAFERVKHSINKGEVKTYLLRGVTGSGKTEIYIKAIEETIKIGKQAIILVPEIALTPQMISRFKGRFREKVAILHSKLSLGEKYDEWRKIHNNDALIALGARSAIFAPFEKLGLIIIDEEHESTYKQDNNPKYHAVEVAKMRAKSHNAVLLLGSATPSVESYARAQKGVYELLELQHRANQFPLPKAKIVDMRIEEKMGDSKLISKSIYRAISDRLHKKEQIILLLNRRGYNNFILCEDCGYVMKCNNCDISMTYHKYKNKMVCHYCGLEQSVPKKCPECDGDHLKFFGEGTQKAEETLHKLWPDARIIRMDMDTTSKKGAHEKIIRQFENGEADILLGTQMISKGLDFPNVTLVGILSVDSTLNLPDYRSGERTFQLISQVSGRAGRHEKIGEVIIQTYNPDHYSVQYASKHQYLKFYENEMNIRRLGKYSPYFFVEQIVITDKVQKNVFKEGSKAILILKRYLSDRSIILGPTIPYIGKIKNFYRTQIIIKYKFENRLLDAYIDLINYFESSSASISIDRYPQVLL